MHERSWISRGLREIPHKLITSNTYVRKEWNKHEAKGNTPKTNKWRLHCNRWGEKKYFGDISYITPIIFIIDVDRHSMFELRKLISHVCWVIGVTASGNKNRIRVRWEKILKNQEAGRARSFVTLIFRFNLLTINVTINWLVSIWWEHWSLKG